MKLIALLFTLIALTACGVKGKPLPPLTAPPIGRGQPTMSQATEKSSEASPEASPSPATKRSGP